MGAMEIMGPREGLFLLEWLALIGTSCLTCMYITLTR